MVYLLREVKRLRCNVRASFICGGNFKIRRAALAGLRTNCMFLFPNRLKRRIQKHYSEAAEEQGEIKTVTGGQNDTLSPAIVPLARYSLRFPASFIL